MDPNLKIQIPSQPHPSKNPLKKLVLLEIGLFEIGFVLMLLVLVFGILNYFNILSLSKSIPILSFLPHKTSGTAKNLSLSPTPIPRYIEDKQLLFSYIKSAINSSYLSSSIDSQAIQSTKTQISIQLSSPSSTNSGIARFLYEKDGMHMQMKRLIISIPDTFNVNAFSSDSARTVFSSLAPDKLNTGNWICLSTIKCFSGTSDKSQKKSFTLSLDSKNTAINYIECEVTKESSLFHQFTICP